MSSRSPHADESRALERLRSAEESSDADRLLLRLASEALCCAISFTVTCYRSVTRRMHH